MKRFHVPVSVDELDQSVQFYSNRFGMQPIVLRAYFAKWSSQKACCA